MRRTVLLALFAGIVILIAATMLLSNQTQELPDTRQPVANQIIDVSLLPSGFEPTTITVPVGGKVRWTNNATGAASVDSAPYPEHNAYPPLNLGLFQPGEMLEFTFTEPGAYQYLNHLDPSMQGMVIVQ